MCTVLQLTERLLLDHAQRLPESKVQYVEFSCCHQSVFDPWTLTWAVERVGLGLCTKRWTLCAFVSSLFAELPPLLNPFISLFSDSFTVPLLLCCWVGPGMFEDKPIKQLRSSCPLWEGTNWHMGSWRSWKWFWVPIRWVVYSQEPSSLLSQLFVSQLPSLCLSSVLAYSERWRWFSSSCTIS